MFKKKTHSKTVYNNFFLLITTPMIIIIISLFVLIIVNFMHNKTQFQKTALSSLNQIATANEENLSSLIKQASLLFNEKELIDYIENDTEISDNILSQVSSRLETLHKSSDIINSIYLINADKSYIIMNGSEYDFENFFKRIYVYDSYSYTYWKGFDFYGYSNHRILSPSSISYNAERMNVIPIVLRSPYNNRTKDYIIMNINVYPFIEKTDKFSNSKNSKIYILNNYTRKVFNTSLDDPKQFAVDDKLYAKLLQGRPSFDFKSKETGNVTVVEYSTSNSFIGYTYYALIPISDIWASLSSLLLYSMSIALIFISIAVLIAYRNASKAIIPIQKMSDIIMPDEELNIENLEKKAIQLQASNNNFTNILPYAQEKYLINYLNSTEFSIDKQTQDILKNTLPFKYIFFAIVVFQVTPTALLFDEYTSVQYLNIQSGFYNIVKDMFISEFDSLVLSSECETLYIVLNCDSDDKDENIKKIIDTLCDYLKNDMHVINFSTGVSKFYSGLIGLKQAHKEALSNLKLIEKSTDKISFNAIEKSGINFTLTDSDETELFNALLSLKIDKAIKIIEKIETDNANINIRSRKQLYTQILNIIFRAMRVKKIKLDESKIDFEIFNDVLSKSIEDVKNEILLILEKIKNESSGSESKDLALAIIQYTEENYCNPNLSLDHMAATFNTNPSYVSSVVSATLKIGFHEYLTNLRITEAKRLLAQTSKNVQEIYTQCGFLSQQTFYRTFKNSTGMTPNSYRKLTNKK